MNDNSQTRHGASGLPANTNIAVSADGLYGWRGTVDMRENPTIGLLIAKMVGVIVVFLAVPFVCISVSAGIDKKLVPMMAAILLGICAFVGLLAGGIYLIYRAFLGGTYSANYLMDNTGLVFRPSRKVDRVTKGVAVGSAIIAAMVGSYGITAAGIAAANTEAVTRFASVYRVKGIKKHCVIKVSEPFLYNQVYVAPQDYDFVYRFICDHCPKARCIEK
ncbi:MAG: hypothetical protein Q4A07_06280 [Coriobacteriales bacterium]|nr:hypothetical protein [Coriobacteriales bacterium]